MGGGRLSTVPFLRRRHAVQPMWAHCMCRPAACLACDAACVGQLHVWPAMQDMWASCLQCGLANSVLVCINISGRARREPGGGGVSTARALRAPCDSFRRRPNTNQTWGHGGEPRPCSYIQRRKQSSPFNSASQAWVWWVGEGASSGCSAWGNNAAAERFERFENLFYTWCAWCWCFCVVCVTLVFSALRACGSCSLSSFATYGNLRRTKLFERVGVPCGLGKWPTYLKASVTLQVSHCKRAALLLQQAQYSPLHGAQLSVVLSGGMRPCCVEQRGLACLHSHGDEVIVVGSRGHHCAARGCPRQRWNRMKQARCQARQDDRQIRLQRAADLAEVKKEQAT